MEQRLQLLKVLIKEKSSAPSNKISNFSISLLKMMICYVTHVNLDSSHPPDFMSLLAAINYIDIKTAKLSLFSVVSHVSTAAND